MSMMIASLLSKLLALAAALGVIAWAAAQRRADPQSQVALYVQHPQRLWIAIALMLLPWLLSMIVWLTIGATIYQAGGGMPVMIVVSAVLAIFGGAVLGLSASSLLEPPVAEAPPRLALAMGVAVVIVLLPVWYFLSPAIAGATRFIAEVAILAFAFFVTRRGTAPSVASGDAAPPVAAIGSPAKGLLLAFAPAALLLVIITVAATPASSAFNDNLSRGIFIAACIFSLVCCFLSSRMLFARRTTGAVLGAIVLLLLNGCIAFAFGCAAILVGASFH